MQRSAAGNLNAEIWVVSQSIPLQSLDQSPIIIFSPKPINKHYFRRALYCCEVLPGNPLHESCKFLL